MSDVGSRFCEQVFGLIFFSGNCIRRTGRRTGSTRGIIDSLPVWTAFGRGPHSARSTCTYMSGSLACCTRVLVEIWNKQSRFEELVARITVTLSIFNFSTWFFAQIVENRETQLSTLFLGPVDIFLKSYDENRFVWQLYGTWVCASDPRARTYPWRSDQIWFSS